MQGLLIPQPHLERILSGGCSFDRRHFSTRKRGRIALVDPADSTVKGFADLTDCVPVSYDDYREQHSGEVTADMWAQHRTYHELRFGNVRRADPPVPAALGDATVWTEVPDDAESGIRQSSLAQWI